MGKYKALCISLLSIYFISGCVGKIITHRPTMQTPLSNEQYEIKKPAFTTYAQTINSNFYINEIKLHSDNQHVYIYGERKNSYYDYITGVHTDISDENDIKSSQGTYGIKCDDDKFTIYNIIEKKSIASVETPYKASVYFSKNEKYILAVLMHTVFVLDSQTGKKIFDFPYGSSRAAFSNDSTKLVISTRKNAFLNTSTIRTYDMNSGKIIFERDIDGLANKIIMSTDDSNIYLVLSDGMHVSGDFVVLDAMTGMELYNKKLCGPAIEISISNNDEHMAISALDTGFLDSSGKVYIFNTGNWLNKMTISTDLPIWHLQFSSNSQLLAFDSSEFVLIGHNTGNVYVLDLQKKSLVYELETHYWVTSICFSPDGSKFASAHSNGEVKISTLTSNSN